MASREVRAVVEHSSPMESRGASATARSKSAEDDRTTFAHDRRPRRPRAGRLCESRSSPGARAADLRLRPAADSSVIPQRWASAGCCYSHSSKARESANRPDLGALCSIRRAPACAAGDVYSRAAPRACRVTSTSPIWTRMCEMQGRARICQAGMPTRLSISLQTCGSV